MRNSGRVFDLFRGGTVLEQFVQDLQDFRFFGVGTSLFRAHGWQRTRFSFRRRQGIEPPCVAFDDSLRDFFRVVLLRQAQDGTGYAALRHVAIYKLVSKKRHNDLANVHFFNYSFA